ncbi:CBASS oligonucleotide cyclase [Muricoccus nepalensis]|uniref:CBASS oligonucleotide cyclase n=1 Tax=Muricoccus nepalensis TaxID=1854500 RepID=UPI0019D4EEFA|nr:CBASS oligonucleotide cyclase [Roseomonas nepalensis]
MRNSEQQSADASFESTLSSELGQLLAGYNGRDVELVRERLEDVKRALEGALEGTLDQVFGGSVAKHTYVDGLSDVDTLLILNDASLADGGPRKALERMEKVLRERLAGRAVITHGQMAVTVEYNDGMMIQLLPAVREGDGRLRVPSSRQPHAWSAIDPKAFQEVLTRRNSECGGKLVPVIKLAKAINGTLPEAQRLSGYHVESLAIAAFRGYNGPKTTAAMLPSFFEKARDLVRSPIRDSTGQSVHVDGYLGDAESPQRIAAGHVLGAIAKRMRNANAAGSLARWRGLFGLDE